MFVHSTRIVSQQKELTRIGYKIPLHCLSADDVTNGHDMVQCSYSKYVSPDPGRTVIELSL